MKNWFTEHPRSVNETYWKHFWFSFKSAIFLIIAGVAAIFHAFFPFLFTYTASKVVAKMTGNYCKSQRRNDFLAKVNHHLPSHESCCIKEQDQ